MSIVYKDSQITLTEWTAHFDQMCWPRNGKYLGDLAWKLRYGEPTKSDMLVAAEVIGAYMALIDKPAGARAKIIKLLKLAEELAPQTEEKS